MTEERFRIRLDTLWQPLLLVGGATHQNSYVELRDEEVQLRFGYLYDKTLPLSNVESVQETSWPWWYGVGWRMNFLGLVGLIGSYQGVVELTLRNPERAMGFLRYTRVAVSLEEPQRFVEAVAKAALKAAANGRTETRAPAVT